MRSDSVYKFRPGGILINFLPKSRATDVSATLQMEEESLFRAKIINDCNDFVARVALEVVAGLRSSSGGCPQISNSPLRTAIVTAWVLSLACSLSMMFLM
jgi:hypothetical protein